MRLLVQTCLWAVIALSWGSASAAGVELKVGVVNAAKVLEDAPQAEAARRRLEKEFAPRDQDLVAMQKKLRSMEEKLEKDGAIMSDTERMRIERDLTAQKREIRRDQDSFREDFNMRRNEELSKLQRQVSDVIVALARENGFDLILTDGVLYASDKVDITEQVLKRLVGTSSDKK